MGAASSLVLWIWALLAVRYDFKLHDGRNDVASFLPLSSERATGPRDKL